MQIRTELSTNCIDWDASVIRGVSLLTAGPLTGHDMEADSVTLKQVLDLIPPAGLKAKLNHRDATGVLSINGRFKNPRIVGGKLRADWYLNPKLDTTPKVMALAEHQPEDAGISLTCKTTKERKDGKNYMRVSGLKSADLVDDPAGNESLLSVPEETDLQARMNEAVDELEAAEGLDRIALHIKFRRLFGENWKQELRELDAAEQDEEELSEDDSDEASLEQRIEETALEVGEQAAVCLETAAAYDVSVEQLEKARRRCVIEDGRLPDATSDQVFAAGVELRRLSNPGLTLTGLESIQYKRGAGVPWSFTCQDFSDPKAFRERAAVIELARRKGSSAPHNEIKAALTALAARERQS